jgi:hypothetical protein
MKPNVPILVGAAVVAGGLGVLLLWQPEPPPQDVAAPSLERIRADFRAQGASEGRDFLIDPPVILSRTDDEMFVRIDVKFPAGPVRRDYHRLVRGEKGWAFDRDLGANFVDFLKREQKNVFDRLGKVLAERYQAAVEIPSENIRLAQRLREITSADTKETRLVGSIEVWFRDGGGESRYIEDFAFANGTWNLDGTMGKLFDRGPKPQ